MCLIMSGSEKKNVMGLYKRDFLTKTLVFEKHNLNAKEGGQRK